MSLSIAEAEKLAGRRLDRRRKYYFIDGWFEPISECGTVFSKSSAGALNTPPTEETGS